MSNEKHTDSNEILLARIDERTKRLEDDFVDLKAQLTSKFVTKEEFMPVKTICYSLVSIICIGVLGALIALVIK